MRENWGGHKGDGFSCTGNVLFLSLSPDSMGILFFFKKDLQQIKRSSQKSRQNSSQVWCLRSSEVFERRYSD